MTATAATSPGTMADDATVGTVAWSNPNNAKVSDNTRVNILDLTTKGITSHYLKATNFGFAISSGATINGILVEIEKLATNVGDRYTTDSTIKLVIAGTVSGDNKADTVTHWPGTEAYVSHGNSTSLWGLSLTPNDINNTNFGVVVSILTSASATNRQVYVDHIRITVYYDYVGTNAQINIGDAWKSVDAMKINIGDAWKDVASAQINIGDAWKTIF